MRAGARAVVIGITVGLLSLTIYLVVVILTTPNLTAQQALKAAVGLNLPVILALPIITGSHAALTYYSRPLSCRVRRKAGSGALAVGSTLTAIASYISLTQVGCCGMWLYILSLMPGLIGTGLTAALIQYNLQLTSIGLIIAITPTIYLGHKIMKQRRDK